MWLIFYALLLIPDKRIPIDLNSKFEYIFVDENGFYYIQSGKLFYWPENDTLFEFELPSIEFMISSFLIDEGIYVRYFDGNEFVTRIFKLDGGEFKCDFSDLYTIQKVGDTYYTPLQMNRENLNRYPYMWMAEGVNFVRDGSVIRLEPTGEQFAKLNHRQVAYAYNFKQMWFVGSEKGVLSVNCLDAKVYLHSSMSIAKEHADGTLIPTNVPYTQLNLYDYKRPPEKPFSYPRVMKEAEAEAYRKAWIKITSFIHYFGAVGNGYFVAYGELRSPNNYLALLDKNFKTIKTLNIKGKVVGARDHKVYVLTPEKHLEAIPVKEL